MGSQTSLGYFVHTLGADLYFNPLAFRPHHRDVQTFVSVGFGHTEPVAKSFGIGAIHIGDDAEDLPAILLFLFQRTVENDADGKEVVDALKLALLFLHFLPNGVDAFCASLHVELQSCRLQISFYGFDETGNVGIARSTGLTKFLLDHVENVGLQIFQTEVFQFAFYQVETQLVCQRSIEHTGFGGYALAFFLRPALLDLPHQIDTTGNDDEDDAHVFCKREQQVAEVFGLDGRILLVYFVDTNQSVYDVGHIGAKFPTDIFGGDFSQCHTVVKQNGQDAGTVQPYLFSRDGSRLHIEENGVKAECVALQSAVHDGLLQYLTNFGEIVGCEHIGNEALQLLLSLAQFCFFLLCQCNYCVHVKGFVS